MQKIDSHVKSQWTHSLNFNLLCLGAFIFGVVALLMLKSSHFMELFIALGMAFGFVMTAMFFTARRNLKFVYNDQHLELQRFPYVAAKKWRWDEVHGIHLNDEFRDESMDKTGEALYMHDVFGNRVLLAHRAGERTELRQIAAEIRRRIA